MSLENLITEQLDIWTNAVEHRKASGRGSRNKLNLYGINKLRELILELAVRGQLVPQDPSDEPASALLEKIAVEKERLIKEGKIKKQKKLLPVKEDEKPFRLPKNWEWARLTKVYYPISPSNKKLKKSQIKEKGKYPVVDQGQSFISGYTDDANLVINLKAPVIIFGDHTKNLKFVNFDFVPGADGTKILKPILIYEKFFYVSLLSYQLENRGYARHFKILNQKLISLPPSEEQQRIVTKVHELMSLCDALEQAQTQHIQAHKILVENLLAALTNTANQGDFDQAWSRIAKHFDTLFSTEDSIDQLKQTILQLAVMGKLVPQNSNDEPASVLLEKIAAEKARLIKEKKIKKQKALPPIGDEEKPFELPEGWVWCRLNDLSLKSEAGWSPKCKPTPREDKKWGILKVSAVTWDTFKPDENKELPSHLDPRKNLEIKSGDFLISRANTAELVAKAVIVPDSAPIHLMMSDKIIRFTLLKHISREYVNLVNNSQLSRTYYLSVAGGTSSSMKNVSREQMRSLIIPLPPLREQKHIVKRFNQLTNICDQLKARLNDQQITQQHLSDVLTNPTMENAA